MRRIDTFKLYTTTSDGLIIPRNGYDVAILVEQANSGFSYISRLPLRHRSYKVAILPQFRVLGRVVRNVFNVVRKVIGSSKYKVFIWPQKDKTSIIIDATQYIGRLVNYTSLMLYVKRATRIFQSLFKQSLPEKKHIILYVIDKSIINKKLSIRQTYIYWLLYQLQTNNTSAINTIDQVFLIEFGDKTRVRLIYDKAMGKSNTAGRLRAFILSALPTKIEHQKDEEIDTATVAHKIVNTASRSIKLVTKTNSIINKVRMSLDAQPDLKYQATKLVTNDKPIEIKKITPDKTVEKSLQDKLTTIEQQNKARQIIVKAISPVSTYEGKIDPNVLKQASEHEKQIELITKGNLLDQVSSSNPLVPAETIKEISPTNLSHIVAQRIYFNSDSYIANMLAKLVKPLLEEIGYKLISVNISIDTRFADQEIKKTIYKVVKIKTRSPEGKRVDLTLNIPAILNGMYVIIGGLRWTFQNILVNIPIFIIEPGRVQFKSNYATITAQYGLYNRIPSLRFYIGGFKIPAILIFSYIRGLSAVLTDFKIPYRFSDAPEKGALSYKLNDSQYLIVDKSLTFEQQILLNELPRILKNCSISDPNSPVAMQDTVRCFTGKARANYILSRVVQFIIDPQTEEVLRARQLPTNIYDILRHIYDLAVHEVKFDKHDLQNMYIKTSDIIITALAKAVAEGITRYRTRKLYNISAQLTVNPNFVIKFLRENGILVVHEQQNPIEDSSIFTKAKIVGPGGLSSRQAVQKADRNLNLTQFGNIDPVDTQESDPGVTLTFANGIRYDLATHQFVITPLNKDYKHIFGMAASIVPFATKDDPARLLMAANQQRQAVPLVSSEHPVVQSGYEGAFTGILTPAYKIASPVDCEVVYVSKNVIVVKIPNYYNGKTIYDFIPLYTQRLQTGSGRYTATEFKPLVKAGQKIKRGNLLVKSPFFDGQLKMGINALAAYMPYKGYTYDDGIAISEDFAKKLTSIHLDIIDLRVNKDDKIIKLPMPGEEFEPGEIILNIEQELVPGSNVFKPRILRAQYRTKIKTIRIYPAWRGHMYKYIDKIGKYYEEDNKILQTKCKQTIFNPDYYKEFTGKFTLHGKKLENTYVEIEMLIYTPAMIGDKLTNRHAAKGVITHIMSKEETPRLPDGTPIDICISPLSVISRMNLGQIYETHVGMIMELARKKILEMYKNGADRNELTSFISELYTTLDVTDGKKYSSTILKNLANMSDKQFNEFIENLRQNKLHIVMPPVNTLKPNNLEKAAKLVNYEFGYKLYLPDLKTYTRHPVTVGILYVNKLEHQAEIKESARNIGRYITTTMQPTRGRSRGGGQRFGELETHCLFAYDAENLLKELFMVNSDTRTAKQQVLTQIIKEGHARLPSVSELSGSAKMLTAYLVGMGIEPNF